MSTSKRSAVDIRSDIARARNEFIGSYGQSRAAILEEAITRKRADRVATAIMALESELARTLADAEKASESL